MNFTKLTKTHFMCLFLIIFIVFALSIYICKYKLFVKYNFSDHSVYNKNKMLNEKYNIITDENKTIMDKKAVIEDKKAVIEDKNIAIVDNNIAIVDNNNDINLPLKSCKKNSIPEYNKLSLWDIFMDKDIILLLQRKFNVEHAYDGNKIILTKNLSADVNINLFIEKFYSDPINNNGQYHLVRLNSLYLNEFLNKTIKTIESIKNKIITETVSEKKERNEMIKNIKNAFYKQIYLIEQNFEIKKNFELFFKKFTPKEILEDVFNHLNTQNIPTYIQNEFYSFYANFLKIESVSSIFKISKRITKKLEKGKFSFPSEENFNKSLVMSIKICLNSLMTGNISIPNYNVLILHLLYSDEIISAEKLLDEIVSNVKDVISCMDISDKKKFSMILKGFNNNFSEVLVSKIDNFVTGLFKTDINNSKSKEFLNFQNKNSMIQKEIYDLYNIFNLISTDKIEVKNHKFKINTNLIERKNDICDINLINIFKFTCKYIFLNDKNIFCKKYQILYIIIEHGYEQIKQNKNMNTKLIKILITILEKMPKMFDDLIDVNIREIFTSSIIPYIYIFCNEINILSIEECLKKLVKMKLLYKLIKNSRSKKYLIEKAIEDELIKLIFDALINIKIKLDTVILSNKNIDNLEIIDFLKIVNHIFDTLYFLYQNKYYKEYQCIFKILNNIFILIEYSLNRQSQIYYMNKKMFSENIRKTGKQITIAIKLLCKTHKIKKFRKNMLKLIIDKINDKLFFLIKTKIFTMNKNHNSMFNIKIDILELLIMIFSKNLKTEKKFQSNFMKKNNVKYFNQFYAILLSLKKSYYDFFLQINIKNLKFNFERIEKIENLIFTCYQDIKLLNLKYSAHTKTNIINIFCVLKITIFEKGIFCFDQDSVIKKNRKPNEIFFVLIPFMSTRYYYSENKKTYVEKFHEIFDNLYTLIKKEDKQYYEIIFDKNIFKFLCEFFFFTDKNMIQNLQTILNEIVGENDICFLNLENQTVRKESDNYYQKYAYAKIQKTYKLNNFSEERNDLLETTIITYIDQILSNNESTNKKIEQRIVCKTNILICISNLISFIEKMNILIIFENEEYNKIIKNKTKNLDEKIHIMRSEYIEIVNQFLFKNNQNIKIYLEIYQDIYIKEMIKFINVYYNLALNIKYIESQKFAVIIHLYMILKFIKLLFTSEYDLFEMEIFDIINIIIKNIKIHENVLQKQNSMLIPHLYQFYDIFKGLIEKKFSKFQNQKELILYKNRILTEINEYKRITIQNYAVFLLFLEKIKSFFLIHPIKIKLDHEQKINYPDIDYNDTKIDNYLLESWINKYFTKLNWDIHRIITDYLFLEFHHLTKSQEIFTELTHCYLIANNIYNDFLLMLEIGEKKFKSIIWLNVFLLISEMHKALSYHIKTVKDSKIKESCNLLLFSFKKETKALFLGNLKTKIYVDLTKNSESYESKTLENNIFESIKRKNIQKIDYFNFLFEKKIELTNKEKMLELCAQIFSEIYENLGKHQIDSILNKLEIVAEIYFSFASINNSGQNFESGIEKYIDTIKFLELKNEIYQKIKRYIEKSEKKNNKVIDKDIILDKIIADYKQLILRF